MEKLNLGCGRDIKEGYINIDKEKQRGVDMNFNLNEWQYPFDDNSVDEIYASHVLEHLDNPIRTLKEWHRICKNGAKIIIRVPHFSAWANYADPTHKHRFSLFYMDYFTKINFYEKRKEEGLFKITDRKLNFFTIGLKLEKLNIIFYPFLNLFPKIYERLFHGILPCSEIYWELEVVKGRKQ